MTRALLVMLSLSGATLVGVMPLAAEEPPTRYLRGDTGLAAETLWFDLRTGRALEGGGVGIDLGLFGSPTRQGAVGVSGGLEIRGAAGKRFSPFGRLEVGGALLSRDQLYAVVSVGGGLALKLDRSWALRVGLLYGLHLGDSVRGPDRAFVGFERRW